MLLPQTLARQLRVDRSGNPARRRSSIATAGHLVGAQILVGVASLAINAMAARTMGPAGRGNLALLLQITYVANMLAMAGTDRSYPATVARDRGPRQAVADMLRLVTPTAVVVVLATVPVVVALADDGALVAVAGFVATAAALVAVAMLRTGAAASAVVWPYLTAIVVGQLVLVGTAVALTAAGTTSPHTWLAFYGVALATGPVVAGVLLRRTDRSPAEVSHRVGVARRLGLRLVPAAVASMVMLRADRLMLPWLGSYEQLGLYIVVATVAEFAIWPVQSYVDARAPRWHQQHLAGELRRLRPLLGAAAYGTVAAIALVLVGHLLVAPVFGEAYRDSTVLLVPLAIGTACYSVSRIAIGLTVATGRARGALAADIPAMATALLAYLLLIPQHGALGAAVGSAIAYGVGAVLAVVFCRTPAAPRAVSDRQASTTPSYSSVRGHQ